jgi:hypothetical protein
VGWGGGRRMPGFRGWWRGSFCAHGVRMGNQTGGRGGRGENHVSVWDALVFGFFEQMGRACLKFGESTNFAPLLNFGPTAGRG